MAKEITIVFSGAHMLTLRVVEDQAQDILNSIYTGAPVHFRYDPGDAEYEEYIIPQDARIDYIGVKTTPDHPGGKR